MWFHRKVIRKGVAMCAYHACLVTCWYIQRDLEWLNGLQGINSIFRVVLIGIFATRNMCNICKLSCLSVHICGCVAMAKRTPIFDVPTVEC